MERNREYVDNNNKLFYRVAKIDRKCRWFVDWDRATTLGQEYSHNCGDNTDAEKASGVDNTTASAKTTGGRGFGTGCLRQARKLRVDRAYDRREGR
jgi:hypothetical protein